MPSDTSQRRAQRTMIGAGYGAAVGLGMMIGGLMVAAQTRPRTADFDSGLCYDSPQQERRFLYIASGVMGAGLALSSGMLGWLIKSRRAQPELRPRARERVLQALAGFGSAGLTTTVLMSMAVGCMSS